MTMIDCLIAVQAREPGGSHLPIPLSSNSVSLFCLLLPLSIDKTIIGKEFSQPTIEIMSQERISRNGRCY